MWGREVCEVTYEVEKVDINIDWKQIVKNHLKTALTKAIEKAKENVSKKIAQKDSLERAEASVLREIESKNLALEGGGELTPLYDEPLLVLDESVFNKSEKRKKSFKQLRAKKKLAIDLAGLVNYEDLVKELLDDPDSFKDLFDDLTGNSPQFLSDIITKIIKGEQITFESMKEDLLAYINTYMEKNLNTEIDFSKIRLKTVEPASYASLPVKNYYISPFVPLSDEEREQIEGKLQEYINEEQAKGNKLFVNVCYSQDISQDNYLDRMKGGRPRGLSREYKYINIYWVNIPGSVKRIVIHEGTENEKIITLFSGLGAGTTIHATEEFAGWEYSNVTYPFLAASGKVFLLPKKDLKYVYFSTGDKLQSVGEAKGIRIQPFGTVMEFKIGATVYTPRRTKDGSFACFSSATDEEKPYNIFDYVDKGELTGDIEHLITGSPVLNDHEFNFEIYKITNKFNTSLDEITSSKFYYRDKFKNFDFLAEAQKNPLETKLIENAPPLFAKDPEVINFVAYYYNLAKTNGSEISHKTYQVYLYTHASLLKSYGLLGNCFSTGLPGAFLDGIKELRYKYDEIKRTYSYSGGVVGSGTYVSEEEEDVSFSEDFEFHPDKDFKLTGKDIQAFKHLMGEWKDVNVNYYEVLSNLVETFKSLEIPKLPDLKSDRDKSLGFISVYLKSLIIDYQVSNIDEPLSEYNDLETDNFDCLYSAISKENKKRIILHYLATDKDDWGNNTERNIIKMFESLSTKESLEIMNELKSNPEYLYNAYEKLDNLMNGSFIQSFVLGLAAQWKQHNTETAFEKHKDLEGVKSEDLANKHFKYIVNSKDIFIIEREYLFTGTESNLILNSTYSDESFLIDLRQEEQYLNTYGQRLFTYTPAGRVAQGLTYIFPKLKEFNLKRFLNGGDIKSKHFEGLNPLDPVVIFVSPEEQKELKLSIPPGVYSVPAYFVHWVAECRDDKVQSFYLTVLLEAIAIATVPFSGGLSLVAFVEVSVAGVGILFAIATESMSETENPILFKAAEFWNKISSIYGGVFFAKGLVKGGWRLLKSREAIINIYSKIKNGKLTIQRTKEFAAKLREHGVKMVSDFGQKLIKGYELSGLNYGKSMINLSDNILLNLQMKFPSTFQNVTGRINPQNKFALMLNDTDLSASIFKVKSVTDNLIVVDDVRFLSKNSENVSKVKYVGKIDNIEYPIKGGGTKTESISLVQDIDNPQSVFAATTSELKNGVDGVEGLDDAYKQYKALNQIDELNAIRVKMDDALKELKAKYPDLDIDVDAFKADFDELADIQKLLDDGELLKTWDKLEDLGDAGKKINGNKKVLERIKSFCN